MFRKLSALLVLVSIFSVGADRLDWDLAVVVKNEIKLLSFNGSEIDSRSQPFSSLKALVYDGVRDQFIVSDTDMDLKNDTIFTVRFTKETDITVPIIRDLPGDVQGLAVDPLEDVLYWTDAFNHTINYVRLNGTTTFDSKEYKVFDDKYPHAIAIDVCNRYIYYTNPSGDNPTIERMRLDHTGHETLVSNTIMTPVGLAIDYKDQRLYWADSRIGAAAGRIESIALDGTDRKLVIERNAMEPYGLAIGEDAIYWTDTNNNYLYKFPKSVVDPYADPEKLAMFSEIPMGLVTKNYLLHDDCGNLTAVIKEYQERKNNFDLTNAPIKEKEFEKCLNGDIINETFCQCKRGYRGKYCDISVCNDDYCVGGSCYISSLGKATCHCDEGYKGSRCQKHICDGYCLNEGHCTINSSRNPKCSCLEGFIGNRCEYNEQICEYYCRDSPNNVYSEKFEQMCRCSYIYPVKNASSTFQSVLNGKSEILSRLEDPVVYLSSLLLCSLLVIVALAVYVRNIKKRRPRIKKRIIVNKNITPLTYRPQQNTEQCEITIENCCNMNICETPCFEPTGEDKKKLLTNMEGEDIY
ncbi:unnamed protein product [Psylliodes chrysocephalus]|uniref:Protein cueball n=1 Tax=Psylliodes chrysocephalus TaxID=3402493 RepID=A0A9P0GA76_9CUCU|nr:unnamed protein product [Psylliodes chrysocephala]